jgi:tetratricopeptide (TPR) repeat protein
MILLAALLSPVWPAAGASPQSAKTSAEVQALLDKAAQLPRPTDQLPLYKKAITVAKERRDLMGEAMSQLRIGTAYYSLGAVEGAMESFSAALPIFREVGDQGCEAVTLNNLGSLYSRLGQSQKALAFYERALTIERETANRENEASTLNNIGSIYADLGQKQRALECYAKVLPIRRALGDRPGEASTLCNIGSVYRELGQLQKALECFAEALPIQRKSGDRLGEASTLGNTAGAYLNLGQYSKAMELYQRAIAIHRELGDRAGQATLLNNIALVYGSLGEKQKAMEFYHQALPLEHEVGDRAGEARTLSNIGHAFDELGHKRQAIEFYERALPIAREVDDRMSEADTLLNLAVVFPRPSPPAAIWCAKRAVNTYQALRGEIGGLSPAARAAYANSVSSAYEILAGLLEGQGRLDEAKQVRALLGDDATHRYSPLVNDEVKWDREFERLIGEIGALSRQANALSNEDLDATLLANLREQLVAARLALQTFLDGILDKSAVDGPYIAMARGTLHVLLIDTLIEPADRAKAASADDGLADVLRHQSPPYRGVSVRSLTGPAATRGAILRFISDQDRRFQPFDTVVVSFRGTRTDGSWVVAPSRATVSEIPESEIMAAIAGSQARNWIVLVDVPDVFGSASFERAISTENNALIVSLFGPRQSHILAADAMHALQDLATDKDHDGYVTTKELSAALGRASNGARFESTSVNQPFAVVRQAAPPAASGQPSSRPLRFRRVKPEMTTHQDPPKGAKSPSGSAKPQTPSGTGAISNTRQQALTASARSAVGQPQPNAAADAARTYRRTGTDYALLIATDDYADREHFPHLTHPVADATKLMQILTDSFHFKVVPLFNKTQDELWQAIKAFKDPQRYHITPDDQLFVYVAGHGDYDPDVGGWIVFKDSRKDRPETMLLHTNLLNLLDHSPFDRVCVMLDVCFGGTFSEQLQHYVPRSGVTPRLGKMSAHDARGYIARKMRQHARLILASGDGTVPDDSRFTAALLDELQTLADNGDYFMQFEKFAADVSTLESNPVGANFASHGDPGASFLWIAHLPPP